MEKKVGKMRSNAVYNNADNLVMVKTNGDESNVIAEDTFENCTNLTTIQIRSGNLLASSIHQYAFVKCAALNYFYYYSYGVTGGNLPDFTGNGNLRTLQMMGNNFGGSIPTFSGSSGINIFGNTDLTLALSLAESSKNIASEICDALTRLFTI